MRKTHKLLDKLTMPALELAGVNGNSASFIGTDWRNFGPRVGFAYQLTDDAKTVIRGGYGLFYLVERGGVANQLAENPPFGGVASYQYVNGYRLRFPAACPNTLQEYWGLSQQLQ